MHKHVWVVKSVLTDFEKQQTVETIQKLDTRENARQLKKAIKISLKNQTMVRGPVTIQRGLEYKIAGGTRLDLYDEVCY